MAVMTPDARRVLGDGFVASVRASDIYGRSIIEDGWVLEEGAALLVAFRKSYFGTRSAGTVDWELAVNGRGIPDDDITAHGDERIRLLMQRGTAFAWEALRALGSSFPGHPMIARVSISEVMSAPGEFTGYVSFFSAAFAEAMRVERWGEGEMLLYLFSEECTEPLPEDATRAG
ncbi:hypothetical protein DZF91_13320 [Actinomadura logoneensis]|uniref:Uncharacterized protein n=1 Tax=Actinomadura logoneensis TaxID=2293572 RepID=A0A372JN06_9ACTN|nr:hypothetical protein [Actinomadura logoneensis]RFU41154.1 hypothetical protein DZF91_13320 [Actinomadura logoneensis]